MGMGKAIAIAITIVVAWYAGHCHYTADRLHHDAGDAKDAIVRQLRRAAHTIETEI